ncbi:MAG: sensor histidine kinase N-terminal domain-containing protein [Burkholderiaceae bacterium]
MNRPEKLSSVSSILGDLIHTHESSPFEIESLEKAPTLPGSQPKTDKAFESKSLFGEILDFMLAPLLLVWPLTIVITLIVARSLADAPYDKALHDKTLLLSQQVQFRHSGDKLVPYVPPSAHELIASDNKNLRYQVRDSSGLPIFGEAKLPSPSLYDYPDLGQVSFRTIPFNDQDLRIAYTYVPKADALSQGNPVLIQIAEGFEQRNQLANSIIKGVIIPQFFVLPIAAALVWFGLARGLRPLRGLRDRIRSRRPDDLSPIDPQSAPHEIVPLVESFNELLGQLNNNLHNQRRFIADAAHQMKTPLAGIRMQAELALRETDQDERNRSLKQLARSSERASHLINQMLALARTENLTETTRFERTDLNDVVREIITELAPMAVNADLDLGFEASPSPAWIRANSILLGELTQNLTTNAIRYTPAGGVINVVVSQAMDIVSLTVEDNGPGIPVAAREEVFSRFYRLRDRLDNNEEEARGSGLGLAIVREIARLHQARINVSDGLAWPRARGAGVGAAFVVHFDRIDPQSLKMGFDSARSHR